MEQKDYKVYSITFNDFYFYIGITKKELNHRLRQHYLKPVSPAMRLFLSNTEPEDISVEVIDRGLSKQEAERKEKQEIKHIYNAGWKKRLLNVYKGGHHMADSLGALLSRIQSDESVKRWTMYGDLECQTPHVVHKPDYKPRCPNCDEVKPLSEFSKDRCKGSGHRSWCKECTRKSIRNHRIENQKRNWRLYKNDIDKFPVRTKVCSKCKKEKRSNAFSLDWGSKRVVTSLCKSCQSLYDLKRYHKKKENA